MRNLALFILLVTTFFRGQAQTLAIPAVTAGQGNNYFIAGTGDGGSLTTYNSFLRLHYGLAIGSPYTSNGSGGYVEKATISFDGRSGNISTLGSIGIGTTSPSSLLHLKNTASNVLDLSFSTAFNGATIRYTAISPNNSDQRLAFTMGGGYEVFSMLNDGRVGIGTTSPNSKLDISNGTTNSITTGLTLFRNGDQNLGIKLLTGIGDDASYGNWNGGIGSWNGIAFHSTLDNVTRGVFNVRTGDFSLKGNINSDANAIFKGNATIGTDGGGISLISGPAFSGAIQIKTHSALGGSANRYLRLGIKDNNSVFYPVLSINEDQNVGIGTLNANQKLTVNGTIYGKEVKVDLSVPGPDYVFEPTYHLSPLDSIKTYIDKNKHLPEVPSAKEMEKNGVNLGEMNMLLLKKIEELTLYTIEMNGKMEAVMKENLALKNRVEKIEKNK